MDLPRILNNHSGNICFSLRGFVRTSHIDFLLVIVLLSGTITVFTVLKVTAFTETRSFHIYNKVSNMKATYPYRLFPT